MSHWVKVKTKVRSLDMLKKALTRMGLNFQEGNHSIKVDGRSEIAQIKFDDAVGLALQKDGTYAMVGDFYYSKSKKLKDYYYNNNKFGSDLSTAYSIEEVKTRLEEKQFYCSENSEAKLGEDGMITMVYESWNA